MTGGWQALRASDPDIALALLFAPSAQRELIADRLHLAIESENALRLASEPMLAAIRLQWWVEAIETRRHESVPLMERLIAHIDAAAVRADDLVSQVGLWQDRLASAPEDAGGCWGALLALLVPDQAAAAEQVGHALAQMVRDVGGEADLAFFDAIAPIIHYDSIDMDRAWFQSRYDKSTDGGDGKDYINCPMDKPQYDNFIESLLTGEKMSFREWEENTPYFEGCMPIEVMASRGHETLRFGPMKPVGLTNAHDGSRPHAVIQLRQDNALGTLYNMVGFQTKLKYAEQVRIFQTIPGLEEAQFARLGGLHRNTFINSPRLLDEQLRMKARPSLRFAGQITGVEGYIESAAIGLMTGIMAAAQATGSEWTPPPVDTAHGALLAHITGGADADTFQPMNVNFGLFPPIDLVITPNGKKRKLRGRERKAAYASRALASFTGWSSMMMAA